LYSKVLLDYIYACISFASGRAITEKVYLIERSSIVEAAFPNFAYRSLCDRPVRTCKVCTNRQHSTRENASTYLPNKSAVTTQARRASPLGD
jgi:hypothetical protein